MRNAARIVSTDPHTQVHEPLGLGKERAASGRCFASSRYPEPTGDPGRSLAGRQTRPSTVRRSSRLTTATSSFTVRSKSRRSMMLTWLWM